jgi:hypothetical protein
MDEIQTRIESRAYAKVNAKPEMARTGSGFPVCRFTVVADQGPASNPVVMPVYVVGGPGEERRRLAHGCGRLRVGEMVQVTGLQRQRVRSTKACKRWRENSMEAMDVQVLGADGAPVARCLDESERLLKGLVVHCMRSPYEVYIGRGNDPETFELGEWGNRFSHRESSFESVVRVASAEEAVALHKADLWERIKRGELSLERLAELAGKTLGCWCAPHCCHGDTLASASVWAVQELARQRAAS